MDAHGQFPVAIEFYNITNLKIFLKKMGIIMHTLASLTLSSGFHSNHANVKRFLVR